MYLNDTLSDRDIVKCCEFSVTAATFLLKLGVLREVPRQETSVRKKWGNVEEKLLKRREWGWGWGMTDDFPSLDMKRGRSK